MSEPSRHSAVYPPPPSAIMRPPSVPSRDNTSSSSSSRKRKRDGESVSQRAVARRRSSHVSTSAATQSTFPSATRREVLSRPDSDKCWNCTASPTHACHVVGKREKQFDKLREMGFIPFDSIHDPENAITLCPLCHANFDDLNDPGFVFVPSDIAFFITWEEKDFRERQSLLQEEGIRQDRMYPTSAAYHEHCESHLDANLEERSLIGGLYNRFTLRDFYPSGVTAHFGANPYPRVKPWQGSPFAALRRGFRALGTLTDLLPMETMEKLRRLQDMYTRNKLPEDENTAHHEQSPGGTPPSSGSHRTGQVPDPVMAQRAIPRGQQGYLCPTPSPPHESREAMRPALGHQASRPVASQNVDCTEPGLDAAEVPQEGKTQPYLPPKGIKWPTSLDECLKYPGLRPESPTLKPTPRWRYGPHHTSEKMIKFRMRMKTLPFVTSTSSSSKRIACRQVEI